LKQIGIATHTLHDTYKVLPPISPPNGKSPIATPGPYQGAIGFSPFHWLLLFIEENTLLNAANRNAYTVVDGAGTPLYAVPISTYRCPNEPSPALNTGLAATTFGGADKWAICNYAVNYLVFGAPDAPTKAERNEGATRFRMVVDGLSHTVFYTERYGTCGRTIDVINNSVNANLWADTWVYYRPTFCLNNVLKDAEAKGWTPCWKFQVTPGWEQDCDTRVAQSPHRGGIHVCMGDGGVRFVSGEIDDVIWQRACDRRDGEVLNGEL
jgi:hypothetical protein